MGTALGTILVAFAIMSTVAMTAQVAVFITSKHNK